MKVNSRTYGVNIETGEIAGIREIKNKYYVILKEIINAKPCVKNGVLIINKYKCYECREKEQQGVFNF